MNKFTKTLLASAILTAVAAPALAVDAITVYGKANVVIQQADENGADAVTEINTNASRFGVKGGVEINQSLNAIYLLEWEVNITDQKHADSSADQIKARNQYVGLEGVFGEFVVGRNDTMLKQSQGNVDQFNDLEGDIKNLFDGENRLGETLTYKSPKFAGLQLGATFIAEENVKQKDEGWVECDGTNAATCDESMTNGFSAALIYGDAKLKDSPVYASVAMDSKVAGKDTLRATVYGGLAGVQLGAMYQQSKKLGGDSEAGYMVSAAYKISDFNIKAQYQDSGDLNLGAKKDKGTAISAGLDYSLAKPTKLYAYYTTYSFDTAGREDDNYVGLGMEHKF